MEIKFQQKLLSVWCVCVCVRIFFFFEFSARYLLFAKVWGNRFWLGVPLVQISFEYKSCFLHLHSLSCTCIVFHIKFTFQHNWSAFCKCFVTFSQSHPFQFAFHFTIVFRVALRLVAFQSHENFQWCIYLSMLMNEKHDKNGIKTHWHKWGCINWNANVWRWWAKWQTTTKLSNMTRQ